MTNARRTVQSDFDNNVMFVGVGGRLPSLTLALTASDDWWCRRGEGGVLVLMFMFMLIVWLSLSL